MTDPNGTDPAAEFLAANPPPPPPPPPAPAPAPVPAAEPAATAVATSPEGAPVPAAGSSGPSKRDLLIGGAVVVVLLLIVGVFLLTRSDSKSAKGGSNTTVSLPKDMLQLGIEYQNNGKLNDAKKAYAAVLTTDPTNKFALYNLGLIAQTQGDNAGAIKYYDQAIASDPKFDAAIYNRALALRDVGRLDEAALVLRQMLTQGETVGVLYNLGQILIAQGKASEGAALVARADALKKASNGN